MWSCSVPQARSWARPTSNYRPHRTFAAFVDTHRAVRGAGEPGAGRGWRNWADGFSSSAAGQLLHRHQDGGRAPDRPALCWCGQRVQMALAVGPELEAQLRPSVDHWTPRRGG
jgi:hypothetical protein